MQDEDKAVAFKNPNGPRNFGLALIGIGVFSLLVASLQYWKLEKNLKPEKKLPMSLAFLVAWSIILLGFFALTNVLFQIGPF